MPYLPDIAIEDEPDYQLWLASCVPACPLCGTTQEDEDPCDSCVAEFVAEMKQVAA
jgi:hypothetical protein